MASGREARSKFNFGYRDRLWICYPDQKGKNIHLLTDPKMGPNRRYCAKRTINAGNIKQWLTVFLGEGGPSSLSLGLSDGLVSEVVPEFFCREALSPSRSLPPGREARQRSYSRFGSFYASNRRSRA